MAAAERPDPPDHREIVASGVPVSKLRYRVILILGGIFKAFLVLVAAVFVVGFAIAAYAGVLLLLGPD